MKSPVIIYLFSFLALSCYGRKLNSTTVKDSLYTPTIELKVKLIDDINKVKLPPDCGIFEVNSTTLKYKVITVIQGDFKAKTILINHRCIKELVHKKIIENKKTYTFKLRPKLTRSDKKVNRDDSEYEVIE